jgi:hypothetical protein
MQLMLTIKRVLEYLGGADTERPSPLAPPLSSWMWGLWWTLLAIVILFFCGQASKFIYVDF